jgi:hypothetical protein
MQFKDLNGRVHSIDPWKYTIKSFVSVGQRTLGDILEIILNNRILEEFPCLGSGGLKLDFFIPALSLAFEFDGRQHYTFTPYFHKNQKGFLRSKENDQHKEEWCKINGIYLVRVNDKDLNEKRLRELIHEATS